MYGVENQTFALSSDAGTAVSVPFGAWHLKEALTSGIQARTESHLGHLYSTSN